MTGAGSVPARECRRGRARASRRVIAGAALALVATLTGCATGSSDDRLYDDARQANLLFKQSVATVLLHISDGTWQVQEYGDLPAACDGGYSFFLHRTTFEGWTLDADGPTTADRIADWLTARGWTTTDAATADDGGLVFEASNPSLGVATLAVEVRDGEAGADAVGVGATSTCQDGDPDELTALLYPGWPDNPADHEPLPAGEPAGATPVFGFTADGEPR